MWLRLRACSMQVKSMSPSELKETLKHTLELKVTPPQLGALTHLFGTGGGAEDGDSSEGGEGYHSGHGD